MSIPDWIHGALLKGWVHKIILNAVMDSSVNSFAAISLSDLNKDISQLFQLFIKPCPGFFSDHHWGSFLDKNPKSSLVTSQLRLTKLYVQIEWQLGYTMVHISNGICQYEMKFAVLNRNVCHFLDHEENFLKKKIQSTETYTPRLIFSAKSMWKSLCHMVVYAWNGRFSAF